MIRKFLFATSILLLPYLACAADPSAPLSVQVVPSGAGPIAPAGAQAAGFTTLALNADFSQPVYANQAAWLDCANNDNTKVWHAGNPGTFSITCNIFQKQDPVTGDKVMNIHLAATDDCSAKPYPSCNVSFETRNEADKTVTFSTPPFNFYYETVQRTERTFPQSPALGGPMGQELWWVTNDPGGTELDVVELQEDGGGYGNDGVANWNSVNCAQSPCGITGWSSCCWNKDKVPPGYAVSDYHKYAMRATSDGKTSVYMCWYIDDILQSPGCTTIYGIGGYIPSSAPSGGTSITPTSGGSLTNADGVWTFGPLLPDGVNANILLEGRNNVSGGEGHQLTLYNGNIYALGTTNVWWFWLTRREDYTKRHFPIAVVFAPGGSNPTVVDRDLNIKYIRIWSCSNWQTQACNGSALVKNGNDVYWNQ